MRRKSRTSGNRQPQVKPGVNTKPESPASGILKAGDISLSLSDNEKRIREAFGNSSDLVIRKIKFGAYSNTEILVVHIDGLVDDQIVTQAILRPIGVFLIGHHWKSAPQLRFTAS